MHSRWFYYMYLSFIPWSSTIPVIYFLRVFYIFIENCLPSISGSIFRGNQCWLSNSFQIRQRSGTLVNQFCCIRDFSLIWAYFLNVFYQTSDTMGQRHYYIVRTFYVFYNIFIETFGIVTFLFQQTSSF